MSGDEPVEFGGKMLFVGDCVKAHSFAGKSIEGAVLGGDAGWLALLVDLPSQAVLTFTAVDVTEVEITMSGSWAFDRAVAASGLNVRRGERVLAHIEDEDRECVAIAAFGKLIAAVDDNGNEIVLPADAFLKMAGVGSSSEPPLRRKPTPYTN